MRPSYLRGRAAVAAAAGLCAALGLFWGATLAPTQAWGWDETMHAQLPAVRMLLAAQAGEWRALFEALHGCAQYPFGWPLVLALVQGAFGIGEQTARLAGIGAWSATLFLLFVCGRELVRVQRGPQGEPGRGDDLLPWMALGLGALSPLPLAFAGTLFLEVPFALGLALALWTWLRRSRPGAGRGADLAAGAALTAACFLKWNYGLLLAAGLGLDALLGVARVGHRFLVRQALVRLAWVLAIPALAALWWLVLPLPFGSEVAAEHRGALLGFLAGNLEGAPTPYAWRALHAVGYLAISGRMLAVWIVGLALALGVGLAREPRRPGARALLLVLLALALPILAHPFHLDRFLIAIGPPLWLLAALGLARVLPAAPRPRAAVLGALGILALVDPGFEARRLAEAAVVAPRPPEAREVLRAHVRLELERWGKLGRGRSVPSPGLAPAQHERLGDLIAGAVGPDERVGWIGISSEYSPAALHLALLERGGTPERLLAAWDRPLFVTFEGHDPGWDAARLASWAADLDAICMTDPPDLRGRGAREFMRRYQQMLVGELGWEAERVGTVSVDQPLASPREVSLYVARPPR